jgi:glycosyltransferase involved in cell wall biosynthesis
MACGVPVVAADAGALPETCGGAALMVAPNGLAVREGLIGLIGDPGERARLRAAGLERASGFGWDRTAREIDALLRRVSSCSVSG